MNRRGALPHLRRVGSSWRVSWKIRDHGRWRQRSRSFSSEADARAFQMELDRLRRTGALALVDEGRRPLRDYLELHLTEGRLRPQTVRDYAWVADRHLIPLLGHVSVSELLPLHIHDWQQEMRRSGVSAEATIKARTVLSGALTLALTRGAIQQNPLAVVRRPLKPNRRPVRPFSILEVERMRRALLDRDDAEGAVLLGLIAWAGLRPIEARALTWGFVHDRSLFVAASAGSGAAEFADTKSFRGRRTVPVRSALSMDLKWLRERSDGTRGDRVLKGRGEWWNDSQWRNWRARVFRPIADDTVGGQVTDRRPYVLRHTAASSWLAEGVTPVVVAERMGHSLSMLYDVYAHAMAEFGHGPAVDIDSEIAGARDTCARPGAEES